MSEFVELVREVFAPLGAIHARRMFGGYGVYRDDLMFALIVDEVLYLKADELTQSRFERRGLRRFEYLRQGRVVQLGYYTAPEDIFDDPEAAGEWAALAWAAAQRNRSSGRSRATHRRQVPRTR